MLFAMIALAAFMLAAVSALLGAGVAMVNSDKPISYLESLKKMWDFVEYSVLCLLVVGIAITFYAVWLTEGVPFATPIKPEVWMQPS